MSIEDAIMSGIVFKGKKEIPKHELLKLKKKVKTKAKKTTYVKGLHNSASSKMKAEIKFKRANRHK